MKNKETCVERISREIEHIELILKNNKRRGILVATILLLVILLPPYIPYINFQPSKNGDVSFSKERCSDIDPKIMRPLAKSGVSTPMLVTGNVKKTPQNSFLWLMAFNDITNRYTDLQEIVISEETWTKEIELTGGMERDKYVIELILVGSEGNGKLIGASKTGSKQPGEISDRKLCDSVEVYLEP